MDRGYEHNLKEKLLSEIELKKRKSSLLKQNNKEENEIFPLNSHDTYQPLVSTI